MNITFEIILFISNFPIFHVQFQSYHFYASNTLRVYFPLYTGKEISRRESKFNANAGELYRNVCSVCSLIYLGLKLTDSW